MKKIKPTAFRPSEEALAILKTYMQQHNIKSKSEAINNIIEEHTNPKLPEDTTGILLKCPLRHYMDYVLEDFLGREITSYALVDTSVCRSCEKYRCRAWEDAESWERINR